MTKPLRSFDSALRYSIAQKRANAHDMGIGRAAAKDYIDSARKPTRKTKEREEASEEGTEVS